MRAMPVLIPVAIAAVVLAVAIASCEDTEPRTPVEKGRRIYRTVCTACHNVDPTQDGTMGGTPGPAVTGSSKALLEAKILRGEYPPGYSPKRDTHSMLVLAHLGPYIDDLTAYLAAAQAPGDGK